MWASPEPVCGAAGSALTDGPTIQASRESGLRVPGSGLGLAIVGTYLAGPSPRDSDGDGKAPHRDPGDDLPGVSVEQPDLA